MSLLPSEFSNRKSFAVEARVAQVGRWGRQRLAVGSVTPHDERLAGRRVHARSSNNADDVDSGVQGGFECEAEPLRIGGRLVRLVKYLVRAHKSVSVENATSMTCYSRDLRVIT